MADHFLPNFKQSLSLADLDPNTDFLNSFPWLNPSHQEISGLNLDCPMGFPHDNIPPQLPECPGNLESFPGFLIHEENNTFPPVVESIISSNSDHKDKKRKGLMEVSTPGSSCAYSSPQVSDNGSRKTHRARRGKKLRVEDDKPREVIHVRAKRGQATDSHSLAERVRRNKINERLRCLQDIVPGCYKSMGMALMLDEIINYVQSLQNQVEFLSTRLEAASMSYNFNSETDAMETMQRAKTLEAMKVQNASIRGLPSAQFAPLGQNFGC